MPDYCIGLLSGTSIDSIDAAIAALATEGCTLVHTHTHPISAPLRSALAEAAQCRHIEIDELGLLDAQLGDLFAEAALALLESAGIAADQIRAVGCHGQTIRHRPELSPRFTWQIGDPTRIAERTGITTVADFRRRDMAAGGQGAPLAPLFHRYQFASPDENRAVVNIGGIANVTLLPGDSRESIAGFDCGPGNILMDGWIQRHRSIPFDEDGEWAASGHISPGLLKQFLETDFLDRPRPKSTGRELFNLEWLEQRLAGHPAAPEDVQATLLEFTAQCIAGALLREGKACQRVLVCGGGARNAALMERLAAKLDVPVESTDRYGLPPEWVEAATFAWLAQRALDRIPSDTPSVTGAAHPVVLGAIYPA